MEPTNPRTPREEMTEMRRLADKHELELHGERGIFRALETMTEQLRWVNRALWGIAASVIAAAIILVIQSGAH